ncbi:hypothetical protein F5146DRAFT_484423 [Armillaria mellea]|nr:hypothetical protein F5146DRAFT_484423 [Armillaria mellea]
MPAVRQKASGNKKAIWYCHFPKCTFKSKTKSGLKIHLNIHYNLKPFLCGGLITTKGNPCYYASGDPGNYHRHCKRLHGDTGESASTNKESNTYAYSKGSSRTRRKATNAQLESDTNYSLQPKPSVSPTYVEIEANGKAYSSGASDLQSNSHGDAKELFPAVPSVRPFEGHWPQQLPVDTQFNTQLANLPFPLVDISWEDTPHTELASSEPSPRIESLRIAMDSMKFHTIGFNGSMLADGPQSIYLASLTAREEYFGAYGVKTVRSSTLSETQSVEDSSCEAYDLPSIDPDVAMDDFLDSLELESGLMSQQVPSAHALSEDSSHETYDSAPSLHWWEPLSTFLHSL